MRQARLLRDLLSEGRHAEAEKVRRHLVSEASTDPEEAAQFERTTMLSSILAEAMRASGEGNQKSHDALMAFLTSVASRTEIEMLVAALFLQIGQHQGWLAEDQYDLVSRHLGEDSPDRHNLIGAIARGSRIADRSPRSGRQRRRVHDKCRRPGRGRRH